MRLVSTWPKGDRTEQKTNSLQKSCESNQCYDIHEKCTNPLTAAHPNIMNNEGGETITRRTNPLSFSRSSSPVIEVSDYSYMATKMKRVRIFVKGLIFLCMSLWLSGQAKKPVCPENLQGWSKQALHILSDFIIRVAWHQTFTSIVILAVWVCL